jgi:chromosome segregation protein
VPDLTRGLEVWKRHPGEICLVTAEGDLIDSRGVVSGGHPGRPESGLLFQKNLISKLELKAGTFRERIAEKKEAIGLAEEGLKERTIRIKDLEEVRREAEEKILGLEKRLIGCQEETKPLERRRQMLDLEEEEYRTQEEDQASEVRDLSCQEETLNSEIEGLRREIREREEGTRVLESNLEEERQALTAAHARLSALKEKGEHIGREWARLKESLTEKGERRERIGERILTGTRTRAALIEKSAQGEAAAEGLRVSVNDLESLIRSANQTWEEMMKEKEEREDVLKETRDRLTGVEREENELRIEAAQMAMKIDHLKEQTLEQSGQPLEEVVRTCLKGDEDLPALREKRRELREKLEQIGEVNLTAIEEYNAFKERHDFYSSQEEDLRKSMDSLKRAIQKINSTSKELFLNTFKVIQEKMNEVFPILFEGGTAKLFLTDENDPLESGVEIMVHPPGKRVTNMSLLSGGEKAMTALALLFSTYLVKPSPFCLLDEIDAFLDEANVERFKGLVRNIVRDSQIILITHNRRIMEMADTLYGVTMEQPGISKLVSIRLDTVQ